MIRETIYFQCVNARFPRIGRILFDLWSTEGFSPYVNRLMHDSRDGERQGFPNDVAVALFKLMQQHDEEYPQHALSVTDIWTSTDGTMSPRDTPRSESLGRRWWGSD